MFTPLKGRLLVFTFIENQITPECLEFYQMETEMLLARWKVLLNEPGNAIAVRGVFQERLDILHRLNELGVRDIEGLSIFTAMEATNASMRAIDKARALKTLPA